MHSTTSKFIASFFALSFLILPLAHATTPYNGVTQGQFSVSPSGAATYTIAIQVPPGINGMQPNLALAYNSQGGNGLLGVGWNLSGVSAITRCPKNPAQDNGVKESVKLDATDRYCLDGQRLVPLDGNYSNYGTDGKEYRTEIDSYSKIISYGSTGTGPSYFKVWAKTGAIIEFGNTEDSKGNVTIISSGATPIYRWAMNKVTDTSGNDMVFHYNESVADGFQSVASIEYVDINQAGNYAAKVEFVYSGDPDSELTQDRSDPTLSYLAGAKIFQRKLLTNVKSYFNRQLVLNYKIYYENGLSTGRSGLSKLVECNSLDVCKEPLSFDWQKSVNSDLLAKEDLLLGDGSSKDNPFLSGDFDGDGKTDLVYPYVATDGMHVRVKLSNGDGTFTAKQDQKLGDGSAVDNPFIIGDFDGDGKTDLVYPYVASDGMHVRVKLSNGDGSFTAQPDQTLGDGSTVDNPFITGDFNGDGKTDLVYPYKDSNTIMHVRVKLSNGDGSFTAQPDQTLGDGSTVNNPFITGDFNGDGKTDLVYPYKDSNTIMHVRVKLSNGDGSFTTQPDQTLGDGSTVDNPFITGDFNGDGKIDLLFPYVASDGMHVRVKLSNGDGFFTAQPDQKLGDGSKVDNPFITGDYNGDGQTDIVYPYLAPNGLHVRIKLSNGDGSFSAQPDQLLGDGAAVDNPFIPGDFSGDGKTDLLYPYTSSGLLHVRLKSSDQIVNNVVVHVKNNNGYLETVAYSPLTKNSVYKKYNDADYVNGYRDIQSSMHVVESVATDDGIGGTKIQTYHYEGLKYDLQGRGSLGFAKQTITDEQTGNIVTNEFNQTFPYVGEISKTTLHMADGKIVSQTVNQYDSINGLTGPIYKPYLKKATSEYHEIDDTNATPYKRVVNEVMDISPYGEPKEVVELIDDDIVQQWHEVATTNVYANPTDYGEWIVGLVKSSETLAVNDRYEQETKRSDFEYYSTGDTYGAGLLKWQIDEPEVSGVDVDSVYLKTEYTYDTWGNPYTVKVSGDPGATHPIKSRSALSQNDFGGGFPYMPRTFAYNAMGEETALNYDPRWGAPIFQKDLANGDTTTWQYNDFGVLFKKTVQNKVLDTIETTWDYYLCDGTSLPAACNVGESYYEKISTSGEGDSFVFYDKLGRKVRTKTKGYFDKDIETATKYNARGLLYQESLPYLSGDLPTGWRTYTYDDLGRVKSVTEPDKFASVTTTTYQGLTTTVTKQRLGNTTKDNVEGKDSLQSISIANPQGQLIETVDADGNHTQFTYYPLGNQKEVLKTSPDWPQQYRIFYDYDLAGRVKSVSDPDMGNWSYEYDALGNLRKQTDAKNQVVTMGYDLLDRLITSTDETDGAISNWDYCTTADNDCPLGNLRRIYRASDNYEEVYSYTPRQDVATVTMDGTSYQVVTNYDKLGRVTSVQYPTYPNGVVDSNGNTSTSVYNQYDTNGYLYKVNGDPNPDNKIYWTAIEANINNQITMEVYGNSLVTFRGYDLATGLPTYIHTGPVGLNFSVQNVDYEFDNFGNLESRTDHNRQMGTSKGVKQYFFYDRLNRLTKVDQGQEAMTVADITDPPYRTYQYNDLGNLRSKSDVGSYAYTGQNNAGPHAVSSVNGSAAFVYDKNGNLTSGRGRSISYSSFNKPTFISQAGASVSLAYNPSHQRYKKVVNNSNGAQTTYYVGQLFEKNILPSGKVEYNNNIYAGDRLVAVAKVDLSTMAVENNYIHTDHLGSVEVITSQDLNPATQSYVKERFYYDPFGKRQSVQFDDGPVANLLSQLDSQVTPKGFTGHEMLPDVGLVHMNGRVYDPEIGRFISADPYVQLPEYSQSYNRYSYVFNNPLSLTDPSGYAAERMPPYDVVYSYTVKNYQYVLIRTASLVCNGQSECQTVWEDKWVVIETETTVQQRSSTSRGWAAYDANMDAYRKEQADRSAAQDNYWADQKAASEERYRQFHEQQVKFQAQIEAEREKQRQLTEEAIKRNQDFVKQMENMAIAAISFVGPDIQTFMDSYNMVQKGSYLAAAGLFAWGVFEMTPWGKVAKIFKGLTRITKRGGDVYEIVDGVRRSKAADIVGNKTIPAQIMQGDKVIGTKNIPIDSLRSPNKSVIDISNNVNANRFFDTLNKTKSGSVPPPIQVRAGSKGVRVRDIELDTIGQ